MACAGIDFGTKTSVVAIARRGGIDICANEVSNRATPSVVSFQASERHVGEAGASIAAQNHRNTVTSLQRLLGISPASQFAKQEAARLTCSLVPEPGTGCAAVRVAYTGVEDDHNSPAPGESVFSMQAVSAMFLARLMETASAEYKAPVKDLVISVPAYYTEAQRRAILDCAAIANLNVLQVINEHAAIALSYGIFRTKELPESNPIKVAFVDIGEASTTVSITAFTNSRCDVLSVATDPSLGGRDLDDIIVNKFAAEFKERYHIDVLSKPKPAARLRKDCEKVKKILSANAEAPLNIECLMDDVDVKGHIKRADLEEIAAPLMDRIRKVSEKAIADAGLESDEKLAAVEIIGASTRVPAFKKAINDTFAAVGAPLRTTLNMDECIARGCALMAAMRSPAFKVRDYIVSDIATLALDAEKMFTDGTPPEILTLVPKGNTVPCFKAMTFRSPGPLSVNIRYSDPSLLPVGEEGAQICSYLIEAPLDSEAKVRTKVRVTENSTVEVTSAQLIKEVEVEEDVPVKTEEKPAAPADNGTDVPMKDGEAAEPAKDAAEPAPKEAPEPVTEKRLVKKMKTTELNITRLPGIGCGLTPELVAAATEKEAKMKANDLYIKERSEAMNSLEAYVYDLRSRIDEYSGDLKEYGPAELRSSLKSDLDATEDWIYSEEAETASKSAFVERKNQLVVKATPLTYRKKEFEERPVRINVLQASIDGYKQVTMPGIEEYAHISDESKNNLLKCVEGAGMWLKQEMAKQEALPKDVDPILACAALNAKLIEIDSICKPIQNTPKPKPKEEEKPESEKKAEDQPNESSSEAPVENGSQENANGDIPMEESKENGTPVQDPESKVETMDVDKDSSVPVAEKA